MRHPETIANQGDPTGCTPPAQPKTRAPSWSRPPGNQLPLKKAGSGRPDPAFSMISKRQKRRRPLTVSAAFSFNSWRRGRDSNPRSLSTYTLSRRAPSTTRTPLRIVVLWLGPWPFAQERRVCYRYKSSIASRFLENPRRPVSPGSASAGVRAARRSRPGPPGRGYRRTRAAGPGRGGRGPWRRGARPTGPGRRPARDDTPGGSRR